jgi:adenosylcobalamin-dependent ribonucleoside-diphosphate reductase
MPSSQKRPDREAPVLFDDQVPDDLPPAPLTDNARLVLARRYLKKDEEGNPTEEPETMFWRVARVIAEGDRRYGASEAAVEELARQFYELMTTGKFEPNSPTLMNAGRPLGQLSACFVLPVDDALSNGKSGIYDTLKSMALVHQSGGGCVAGDAHVHTTFCGVETIERLYQRVRARGVEELVEEDHRIMDIRHLDIRTLALDADTGKFEPKQVTHLWKWDVPAEKQITVRCEDGSEVTSSEWHPFMVLTPEGIVEKRADELKAGERLVSPNRSVRDSWPVHDLRKVGDTPVDEGLAWFAGCFAAAGAMDLFRNRSGDYSMPRMRLTTHRREALDRAAAVASKHGVHVAPLARGDSGWDLSLTNEALVPVLSRITEAGFDGHRTVPEWVGKSPLTVVAAWLGGVVDGGARLDAEAVEVAFPASHPDLARRLTSLLSALGFAPDVEGEGEGARVVVSAPARVLDLVDFLQGHVHDPVQAELLATLRDVAAPLVCETDELPSVRVTSVARAAEPKDFYDFTVEDHNNYLAGGGDGKMLVIHNTGFSFSRLRPTGDTVRSTMGVASGAVSFMRLYDASTEVVKQGGTRRGANMGILRVDHPDIREFITCKDDTSQITNFNISVAVTDAFMEALKTGKKYDLLSPRTGEVMGQEDPREIFDMIVHGAWKTGEPGVFFIDRANEYNPVPALGSYEATNPCGEQPLLPYDVCNLGSVNVGKFVNLDVPADAPPEEKIDWEAMGQVVRLSTHFLDNVIDANRYPLDEITELAQTIRRIGLGIMGWADLLVRVGIPYDSPEGVEMGRKVMEFVNEESRKASEKLAEERDVFPAWEESIWGPDETCARRPDGSRIRPERRLRNCNLTTVAPTGTISIFAGCSGGIEPLFAVAFMRNQAGAMMPDVNDDFVRIAKEQGWYSDGLMERIAQEGHIHFDEVPEEVQRVFVTSHDISPEWHVRMQAAFQEHTDSAISKCLAAGTLIPTHQGLVPVEAFAEEHAPDTFAETNDEYWTGGHRILSHYRAGKKPATRVRLDNGAELVGATGSHRVMTPDGWRLMSDLAPGDLVLGRLEESHGPGGMALGWNDEFRANSTEIPTPTRMTPDLARFLGMVAADGYTLEADGRVEISCKDEDVEAEFRRVCKAVFGLEPKETVDCRNQVKRLYLTSRNLVRFVESLLGRGAYEKRAPEAILRGSFEEKLNFLEGVTLDGYATPQGLVLYGGMSRTLAYHVAELARSFGLPWVVQGRKWVKSAGAYAHDVTVSNEMQELVTPVEPHKRRATVYKRYKVHAEVRAMSRSHMGSSSGAYFALREVQRSNRPHMFNTTAERIGVPSEVLVHRVTEVEDAGSIELYDVEVEGSHRYVVNGIVSHNTTNFSNEATEEQVREIYELAFELNCKGVTVYRDGSRPMQVLSTGKTGKSEVSKEEKTALEQQLADAREEAHRLHVDLEALRREMEERDEDARASRHKRQRPALLRGRTVKMNSPLGDLYVTINEDESGRPFEVFCTLGKAGGAAMADSEAIGRLASLALRSGIPITAVRDQLRGISCDRAVGVGPNKVLSAPDAVAQAIDRYLAEREGIQEELPISAPVRASGGGAQAQSQPGLAGADLGESFLGSCPDCGTGQLAYEEGCVKCHVCGYSECG